MNGTVIAIAVGCALVYYAGKGVVTGVKKVEHGIVHIFHKPKPQEPAKQ